jgi:hypothetical protein
VDLVFTSFYCFFYHYYYINKRSGAPLELWEIKDLWLLYIVYLGVGVDGWDLMLCCAWWKLILSVVGGIRPLL